MKYKQVIVVREDLKLSKGKLAVQVAHASVECILKTSKAKIEAWKNEGMKKAVLKVKDIKELHELLKMANNNSLVTALINDAGLTEIPAGTTTCLGIGPDEEDKIDAVTGKLKLLS